METPPPSERIRNAAVLLPILGIVLVMPPAITLFVANLPVAGIPLIVVYVFGVWLALIAAAAFLSRRL